MHTDELVMIVFCSVFLLLCLGMLVWTAPPTKLWTTGTPEWSRRPDVWPRFWRMTAVWGLITFTGLLGVSLADAFVPGLTGLAIRFALLVATMILGIGLGLAWWGRLKREAQTPVGE